MKPRNRLQIVTVLAALLSGAAHSAIEFSGTWEQEWAVATRDMTGQKFESLIEPRWDIDLSETVQLTAIGRIRLDATDKTGPRAQKTNYSGVNGPWYNNGHAEFGLREFYLDAEWGDNYWRIGKQQVVWGQADGIKVLDVVNPQSFREFILDDFDDSRIPLWMLNVEDGKPMGTPTQIKETADRFIPKGFTPNGSFYYVVGKPDSDVYVAALDFETGKVLTPPTKTSLRFEGTNHAPIWSPDGNYLAYASRRSIQESYVLVIRSVETGQERDLSPKSLGMAAAHAWGTPRWSPDGRSILVAGLAKGATPRNYGLHLVDVQTGDFTTLVQDVVEKEPLGTSPRYPVFSNDGKQINYVRGQSIMTFDLNTRQESELYRANSGIYMLATSPDGQQLAFCESSEAVNPSILMTIPASGGEPRELFEIEEGKRFSWDVGLSWTPDGQHVVVGRPGATDLPDELWIIPATGGEPRKLNLGFKVRKLSLHPDGRRIAFGQRFAGGGDIWVMENFLP